MGKKTNKAIDDTLQNLVQTLSELQIISIAYSNADYKQGLQSAINIIEKRIKENKE